MNHESNQYDAVDVDIDRTLSALRTAAPPAGMDDRILSRLDARLAEEHIAVPTLRSAWLRGALTGALTATTACAALFFATRLHHTTAPQIAAIAHHAPAVTPAALHINDQCTGAPSIRDQPALSQAGRPSRTSQDEDRWDEKSAPVLRSSRDEWSEKSARAPRFIPASFAPSHPAPPAPPTAQERALIQLVRNAGPAELAALNRPTDGRSDAEREAAFNKFFGPSDEVRAIDEAQQKALGITDNQPAAPKPSKEGQL